MHVSLHWLQRHVDLGGLDPAKIAEDLTLSTAEVDDVVRVGEGLGDIVIGRVVECGKHPDADKLSLTKVDAGTGQLLQVVCGAPNVARGQTVAVAKIGALIPADGKRLKKTKIRGVESEGMICSERELGLSDDHQGILVLDDEKAVSAAAPGTPLADLLPLRDVLFVIDNKSITHRPDLWGHYGFARELAAIYGRPLKPYLDGTAAPPTSGETVPIDIAPSQGLCARYAGVVVRGVTVGPSPAWLRWLLRAIGQRAINNVVDLTNFVLHDLGQPMHAFDLARLHGPAIAVRRARDGETMHTLDGQERRLTGKDLLICDAQGPVALAGVMGGQGSMVETGTTALLLESATFDAVTIRRTALRLGLRTDASSHFEKSLDPAWAETGARKFVELLDLVVPGARAAGPLSDPAGWQFAGRRVRLRLPRVSRLLGMPIDEPRVRAYLEPLGFALHAVGGGDLDVAVPSWRATKDIAIEEDLVEELGRRHRYDNVAPQAPRTAVVATHRDPELALLRRVRECLARDCGYHEAYNYSFLADDLIARLELGALPYARVTNAIASHLTRVRRSVLPSLLGSLRQNLERPSCDVVSLFEAGKGYRPDEPGETLVVAGRERTLPREVHEVAALYADRRLGAAPPLAAVRGHLEHLLRRLGRPHLGLRRLRAAEAAALPWMHPGRTAAFTAPGADALVAWCGDVHPKALAALEVESKHGGAAALCLDLRALLAVPEQVTAYEPVPVYPEQPVDLAFLVDEAVLVADLLALCREAGPRLVRRVEIFEVYRGKGLPDGKKSLNFTVSLGSDKRTLGAEDEEKYIARVRELAAGRGFELRG